MAQQDKTEAFDLLLALEQRSVAVAVGLPQQQQLRRPWSGIGFRVGKQNLVAAVGDVNEILYLPQVTLIPGTKSWVKGMANIRGNLMPVLDLQDYLGTPPVNIGRHSRILVVNHLDLWAGLLVDEVFGLKHFYDDEKLTGKITTSKQLAPYLTNGFRQNDNPWYIFSMKILTQTPDFLRVAV